MKIKNLGSDIADGKSMTVVLNQLDKANCSKAPLNTEDKVKRAEEMIANSQNMKPDAVPYTASGKDISKGNTNVNTEFVANVFNTKHGLELDPEDLPDFAGLGCFDETGSREEQAFRYWINSLELEDTDLVDNLYGACSDGKILLRVCDKIKPGCVDWPATVGFKDKGSKIPSVRNPFDVAANCNQAFLACEKVIGKPLHGLNGIDIQNCDLGGDAKAVKIQRKNLLAMVWQLVRQHALQILGNKSEADVLAWANEQCPED